MEIKLIWRFRAKKGTCCAHDVICLFAQPSCEGSSASPDRCIIDLDTQMLAPGMFSRPLLSWPC